MIASAVDDENRNKRLAQTFINIAKANGKQPRSEDIDGVVTYIRDYIEYVPALLEATVAAAQKAGIAGQVLPILQAAEQYFLNPNDLIPDHLGLLGLMDDAYLTLSLIQAISRSYQQQSGTPLVSVDLSAANNSMRALIGEPLATQLDQGVIRTLQMQQIQQAIRQLTGFGATLPLSSLMHASNLMQSQLNSHQMDNWVNTQLGSLGIL